MNYWEYTFSIVPDEPGFSVVMAYLDNCGFESFLEEEGFLKAYTREDTFNEAQFKALPIWDNPNLTISYQSRVIPHQNWNALWEADFDPIRISEECVVRASFHPPFNVPFEIVITPNMSFGTGHHETTQLMLNLVLEMSLKHKTMLDMGCGTGVLAILGELKGAAPVIAVDTDPICVLNTRENARTNHCKNIEAIEGDASVLNTMPLFDLICANINKNVLLNDIPVFSKQLNKGGNLLLSGFYNSDLDDITAACIKQGMRFEKKMLKNNWVAAKYVF